MGSFVYGWKQNRFEVVGLVDRHPTRKSGWLGWFGGHVPVGFFRSRKTAMAAVKKAFSAEQRRLQRPQLVTKAGIGRYLDSPDVVKVSPR